VKQHLLIALNLLALILLSTSSGCRSSEPSLSNVPAQGFVKQWEAADLSLHGDSIKALHARGSTLIAYTKNNKGFWFGAAGGDLMAINQLGERNHVVHPPVLLTDHVVIPTTVALFTFDSKGSQTGKFTTPTPVQSPGAGVDNSIYLGVAHTGGGRLARLDIGPTLASPWEVYTELGVRAAPAVLNQTIFAGGLDGRVFAVTPSRAPIWTSLADYSFKTDGPITADLVADDFGLYVASQDQKLYCLDRDTGKIKWTYYAGLPLVDAPVVLGNAVYQHIPDGGIAAINKTEGKFARDPMWVQPLAQQILSADEKYIYAATADGIMMALDPATGKPQFHSSRSDLRVFATNLETSLIYAATSSGKIMAVRPVLKPGGVGEVVFENLTLPWRQPIAELTTDVNQMAR
jgi:outer membrane protein assembly factor BamB